MTTFSWPVAGQVFVPAAQLRTDPDYGLDWFWQGDPDNNFIGDVDPMGRPVTGPLAVAQAISRRLVTTRGTLFYDPEYGFNVRDFLNESIDAQALFQMQSGIEGECLKDERVEAAQAYVEFIEESSQLIIAIQLVLSSGPFELVLGVDAVTTELLMSAL